MCGSCYIFGSMGSLEARLNIVSKNEKKLIFSPQEVIDCSEYSQGCGGGFPYLTAGKYAMVSQLLILLRSKTVGGSSIYGQKHLTWFSTPTILILLVTVTNFFKRA